MKKLLIASIFAMILLSSGVFASEIYQYNVVAEISEQDISYKTNFILVNHTDIRFSFNIPGPIYDVDIEANVDCNVKDSTWGQAIECVTPLREEKINIGVSYKSKNKVSAKRNYFIFADSFTMPDDVKDFSLLVKLPEANGLIKADDAFSPEDALLGSDGRRPSIYWTREDLVQGYTFDVSVAYEPIGEFDYSIIEMVFIVLITIVILGAVFLKYFSKPKQEIKVILPVLKEDEKLIFETLIKHEPGVNQKTVVRESGYSKAKVSKVLKNLQERGLVKLERIGRTNKIHYDPKFRKKNK